MINLNDIKEKKQLTKENLLEELDPYNIYRYYVDEEFNVGRVFSSPFDEDKKPSFNIWYSKNNNELFWKDFRHGSGDSIMFVSKLLNLNYFEALSRIASDFGITDRFRTSANLPKRSIKKPILYSKVDYEKELIVIKVKSRNWTKLDFWWWAQFGITKEILKKNKITPLEYFFIDDNIIKAEKFSYAYPEYKDQKLTYKIYQPYSQKNKWYGNHDYSVIQGWSQLPEKSNKLIITSSLKDALSIQDTILIPSIAPQAESTKIKDSTMLELIERFDEIYIFYDNDFDKDKNWGQISAKKLTDKYKSLKNIYIPDEYKSKDYSDLVKNKGFKVAIELLDKLITNQIK